MRFENLPEQRKKELFEFCAEGRCEALHSTHLGKVVIVYSETYDVHWAFCEKMVQDSYHLADFCVIKK